MEKEVKRLEKSKIHADISTNPAVFADREFPHLQAGHMTSNSDIEDSAAGAGDKIEPPALPSRFSRLAVSLSILAGLMTAFALWLGIRRKRGSA